MRFFHTAVGEARDLVVFKIDSTIRSLAARREGGGSGHPRRRPPLYLDVASLFSHVTDMSLAGRSGPVNLADPGVDPLPP